MRPVFKKKFLPISVIALLCYFIIPTIGQGQVHEAFPLDFSDFNEHQQTTKEFLQNNSLTGRTDAEISLNLPFSLEANAAVPYRGKFLLFHGLNDSPFVWADIGKDLSHKGFDVRAILLPGHGAHPKFMLDIKYEQWLAAARKHLQQWNVDDTPMYLGGFSLGGVISTILALENNNIDGLLLISPAFHSKLNNYLRWSSVYSLFKDWLFGTMLIEDNPAKYNSIAINSGAQYFQTTRYLKKKWRKNKIDIPTLIVVTENDSVVDVEYTRDLFQQRFTAQTKSLVIYSANPQLDTRSDEIRRNSYHPELRILNQSHLSLTNSPTNILYTGTNPVLICNGNEYPIFIACLRAKKHWFGAQHTPSPDGVAVARATYNPDYRFILSQIDQVFTETNKTL